MSTKQNKIRFAIVGLGHIGNRHADVIAANPECELTAVCDTNPGQLVKFDGMNIGIFTSLEDLLSQSKTFDVLCVATPNGLHEEQAVMGLKSGLHIVLEKPMALTKAGCERIIYEALQHHKYVFCVMQNRYSPSSVWIKRLVESKILGKIFVVQINCYWNRDERYYQKGGWHGTETMDGGPLFTQFSHFVDIMYWLFGDIKNIQTRFQCFNRSHLIEFEDSGTVTFDFINGGSGTINYSNSIWDRNFESTITIIAENGTVKIGGQYMNHVEYCHIRDYQMPELQPAGVPNDYGLYKGSAANHQFIYQNVVDVIKGRETITTNALEGLKVVEIIERIYSLKQVYH